MIARLFHSLSRGLVAAGVVVVLVFAGVSPLGAQTMSASEQTVIRAYLAYYGRPPDPGGLAYWAGRLEEAGSLDGIMDAFGNSPEFQERYGALSPESLVNNLYRQTFGRDAEPGGLAYWTGELESGARSLSGIALEILYGAQNSDAVVVTHRALVAESFVLALDGQSAQSAYSGNAVAEAVAALMASVTSDPLSAISAINGFSEDIASYLASAVAGPNAEAGADGDIENLYVPEGFAFSSSWVLTIDIDVSSYLDEAAYLLICGDFAIATTGYDINYGTCQLKAPLSGGRYQGDVTMTDNADQLLVAVLPLSSPDDAIYFEWEAGEGTSLTIR